MNIIENIKKRAKGNRKTIILPESMDDRVLKAAEIIVKEKIANIIIIGNEEELKKKKNIKLDKIKIIDQHKFELTESLIEKLYLLRKEKGLTEEEATKLIMNDNMYFACMLLKEGYADGIVSGACHSSSNTLRPALQIIKTAPNVKMVSSFFLMEVPNCKYGYNGNFIFADCGLEQNPTSEKLAVIAGTSAQTFKMLTKKAPKVALLSHSTKGSAKHIDVDKVVEATKIAQKEYPIFEIDGELQLDAAIIPEIAKMKAPKSKIAGHANVLIFPDLDSGNIGYKLVERLANAKAYGPITQGMLKPVNDLSRGCSVEDIVGVVAITALQATK